MTIKEQLSIGEYFADYDEDSASWCIFHTDYKTGFAFKSFASQQEAESRAEEMNKAELDKCF